MKKILFVKKINKKYKVVVDDDICLYYNTFGDIICMLNNTYVMYNYVIYIYDFNFIKYNILYEISKIGYKYSNDKNLKTYTYNGYIDCNNNVYFLNLRYKNQFIKFIDLFNIFNYKKIKKITDKKIYDKIKKITSLYGFENTIGKYAINNFLLFLKNKYDKKYKYIYPELNKSQYNYCYNALYGGVNYLNENFKNKKIKNINVYDINSLYPSVMMNEKLPYGKPVYYTGEYKKDNIYNLFIQHIKVEFEEGKIPFLNFSKNYYISNSDNIKSSNGILIDLYMTNIDLKNFLKYYKIKEIYYIDGLKFKSTDKIYKEYVKKMYALKEKNKNDEVMKKFYKSMLNLIYGKFATKLKLNKKSVCLKNEKITFELLPAIKTKTLYMPVANYIGAYGRDKMLKKINNNIDNFIYTDTDSLHLQNKKIETSKKIGEFKCEMKNAKGIYLQNKLYYIKNKDEEKKVICGAPDVVQDKIKMKNFKKGVKIKYVKIEIDEKGNKKNKKYIFTI